MSKILVGRYFFKVLLAATVFGLVGTSSAEGVKGTTSAYPAPIQAMMNEGKGVRFQDKFDAPGGLTGYVLSSSTGERRIYYVTPDKKHAIFGIMVDSGLNNVTAEHQKTYMDVLEFLSPTNGRAAEEQASAIDLARRHPFSYVEGRGSELYVVFDSECTECAKLYRDTRPYLDRIRVRWIPVALHGVKSSQWLEEFVRSPNKDKTLQLMFSGAAPPAVTVSPEAQHVHLAGLQILRASSAMKVPLALYVDSSNAERVNSGSLQDGALEGIAKLTSALSSQKSVK